MLKLVDVVRYYLGTAVKRLSLDVKRALLVASLGSYPAEKWCLHLLEDDRWLRTAPAIWASFAEEILYRKHIGFVCKWG